MKQGHTNKFCAMNDLHTQYTREPSMSAWSHSVSSCSSGMFLLTLRSRLVSLMTEPLRFMDSWRHTFLFCVCVLAILGISDFSNRQGKWQDILQRYWHTFLVQRRHGRIFIINVLRAYLHIFRLERRVQCKSVWQRWGYIHETQLHHSYLPFPYHTTTTDYRS